MPTGDEKGRDRDEEIVDGESGVEKTVGDEEAGDADGNEGVEEEKGI